MPNDFFKQNHDRSTKIGAASDGTDRGAVLIAVIIIFAIMSVVGTTVLTSSYAAAQQSDRQLTTAQAKQNAQAGVNDVTAYLNQDKEFCDTTSLRALADQKEGWTWGSTDGSNTVTEPSCPPTASDTDPRPTLTVAITGSATGKLPRTGTQTYTTRVTYTAAVEGTATNGQGIPGSGITSASTSDVNLLYSQALGENTGITSNGNVSCQGNVQGNITAKGSVTIYPNCNVTGNVVAGGTVTFKSSNTTTVTGNITSVGDITIENGSAVQGSITSGGKVSIGGPVHSLYAKGTVDITNGSVSGDIVSDSDITIENSHGEVTCADPSLSAVVCGNIVSLGGSVVSKRGGQTVASGDVYAGKTISLTSSGVYLGNLYAAGDISLTHETIDKNIYSQGTVNFTNWWGTVKGNVSAQHGITVTGGSQHIYGNITVPAGSIQIADNLHIEDTPTVTLGGTVDTSKLPSSATVVQNASNIPVVQLTDPNSFSYPHDSSTTDSPQLVKKPDAPATVVLPQLESTQSSLASWSTPANADGSSRPAIQRYIFSSSNTYANGVQSWKYDSCRRAENFINQGSWGTDTSGKETWTMVQVGNCSEPMELAPWTTNNLYYEQAESNGTLLLHGNLILISDSGFNLTHGLTIKSPAGKHYSLYLIVPSDAQEYVSGSSFLSRMVSGNIQTGVLSRDDGNNYTTTVSDGDAWYATKSSYISWNDAGVATCSPAQSGYGDITFGQNQKYDFVSDSNSSVDVLMYTPCVINDSAQLPSFQGIISASQVNITGGMTFDFTYTDMFLPWTGKTNSESGTPSSNGSSTGGGSSSDGAESTGWQSLYYSVTQQERCRDANAEKGQGTCHD